MQKQPQPAVRFVDSRTSPLQQLLELARPFNALQPMMLVIVGFMCGGGVLGISSWPVYLYLALCMVFLLHSAATIANDLADRQIDRDNNVSTPITQASPQVLRLFWTVTVSLYVIAGVLGYLLGPLYLFYWFVIVALSAAYNHRPFYGSRRPLASLFLLALLYGFIPFFIGYSLTAAALSWQAVLFAGAWGGGRASLSILKDFKDISGDKKHKKETFLLHYGEVVTLRLSIWGGIGSFALLSLLVGLTFIGRPILWFYIPVQLLTLVMFCQMRYRLFWRPDKNQVFHFLLYVQVFFDLLFILWLNQSLTGMLHS